MVEPALQRCVGDVESFFDKHWGSSPLLRRATASDAFADLASLSDLDHIVASLGLHGSSLRMVKDGAALPPSEYTAQLGKSRAVADPVVSPSRVYERYLEGGTIVLESLHRYWRPLTDFCRELELSLGHRLQVNAYLTPPGSRGFDVHRDDHDVFVLQVAGSKHWIVYDASDSESVLIDEEVRPGDALYIPEGFPHAATTGAAASAHLTVGILTHDRLAVLREMVNLAEQQPSLRERLDLRSAADVASLRRVVEREVDEVKSWLDKIDLDDLTGAIARRVWSSAQPVTRGMLHQFGELERIGEETVVHRRQGSVCILFPEDTTLKVLLVDRQLEMPAFARPAMEEAARRERLSPADLLPFLDAESAVVLVRRLVREGLFEVRLAR